MFKYTGKKSWLHRHPTLGVGDGESYGFAFIPTYRRKLAVVFSHGRGWEHVSVSRQDKMTPTWDEMCFVKGFFWDEEDTVVQFHPPKSKYVNHHPGVLHLWRQVGSELQVPEPDLVGPP